MIATPGGILAKKETTEKVKRSLSDQDRKYGNSLTQLSSLTLNWQVEIIKGQAIIVSMGFVKLKFVY